MDNFPLLNICLCKLFLRELFATPLVLLLLLQLPRNFEQSTPAMLIKGVKPKLTLENWSENCLFYLSLPQEQFWAAHMGGENSIIGTNMHVRMLKAFTELLLWSLKKYRQLFGSLVSEVEPASSTHHLTTSALPRCIQQTSRTICYFFLAAVHWQHELHLFKRSQVL